MPLYPRTLQEQFTVDDLVGQFVIARDAARVPERWSQRALGRWTLAAHPALPAFDIRDGERTVGWLLGYAIGPDGEMVLGEVTLPPRGAGITAADAFLLFVESFAGRFIAVLLGGDAERVYLDPTGSLSAVYCPSQEMVAATPSLVPYTDETRDNDALIEGMAILERNGFYPFGLTPRHGIERLLPNHYLDLRTWRAHRFWPRGDFAITSDVPGTVERMAHATRRNIEAVARRYPLWLSLTAGMDSRMLVACARRVLDRVEFFTFSLDDHAARVDCDIAQRLAARFELRHRVLPFVPPHERDSDLWLFRTGGCVAERRGREVVRTYRQLDPERAETPGMVGELGRHACFSEARPFPAIHSGEQVLAIAKLAAPPQACERGDQWLADLPVRDRASILAVIYIELRLAAWGGLLPYADPVSTRFRLYPLCERRIVEWMASLPPDYRERQQLGPDLIRVFWPELAEIPFNRYVGWKHFERSVKFNIWRWRRRLGLGG